MSRRKREPARDPENRLQELVSLAVDLAEKKLRDGTASSQIITTLLNYGTEDKKLEREKIRSEIRLRDAKIQEIKSGEEMKELYSNAIEAMRTYQGYQYDDEYDEDYYEND